MLRSQAATLNQTGLDLLSQAKSLTKVSESQSAVELGMKCLAEARDILENLKRNSILIFIECCMHLPQPEAKNYGAYLDFCARNSLDVLSEQDFNQIIADLRG